VTEVRKWTTPITAGCTAEVQYMGKESCKKTFPYRHFNTFCYLSIIWKYFRQMINSLLQKIRTGVPTRVVPGRGTYGLKVR